MTLNSVGRPVTSLKAETTTMLFISCQITQSLHYECIQRKKPGLSRYSECKCRCKRAEACFRFSSPVFPYRCPRWWAAWRGNHSPAPWPPAQRAVQDPKPSCSSSPGGEAVVYKLYRLPGLFWAVCVCVCVFVYVCGWVFRTLSHTHLHSRRIWCRCSKPLKQTPPTRTRDDSLAHAHKSQR